MLVSKAVEIFEVLLDKYGSPNIIESEILNHFEMATYLYLNRMFPDSQGGIVNFDLDSNVTANIQPLIYVLEGLTTAPPNVLANGTINTALQTASAEPGATYFRIVAIGSGNRPVKYVKHNNLWAHLDNSFKAPTTTYPLYTLVSGGIQLYPTTPGTTLTVTVVKTPRAITTTSQAFEFIDYAVYNIIAIAVKLAGVGLREDDVINEIRVATAPQ